MDDEDRYPQLIDGIRRCKVDIEDRNYHQIWDLAEKRNITFDEALNHMIRHHQNKGPSSTHNPASPAAAHSNPTAPTTSSPAPDTASAPPPTANASSYGEPAPNAPPAGKSSPTPKPSNGAGNNSNTDQ